MSQNNGEEMVQPPTENLSSGFREAEEQPAVNKSETSAEGARRDGLTKDSLPSNLASSSEGLLSVEQADFFTFSGDQGQAIEARDSAAAEQYGGAGTSANATIDVKSQPPKLSGTDGEEVTPSESASQVGSRHVGLLSKASSASVARTQAEAYKRQRDVARQKLRDSQREIEQLQDQLEKLQDAQLESDRQIEVRNVQLEGELTDAQTEIARLQVELQVTGSEASVVKTRCVAAEQELKHSKEQVVEVKRLLAIAEQQLKPSRDLVEKCRAANAASEKSKSEKDTLVAKQAATDEELCQLRIQLRETEGAKRSQAIAQEQEAQQLRVQIKEIESKSARAIAQKDQEIADNLNSVRRANQSVQRREGQIQDLQEENQSLQDRLDETQKMLDVYSEQAADLASRLEPDNPPVSSQTRSQATVTQTAIGYQTGITAPQSSAQFGVSYASPLNVNAPPFQQTGSVAAINLDPTIVGATNLKTTLLAGNSSSSAAQTRSTPASAGRFKMDIPPPEKLDVTRGHASRTQFKKWKKKLKMFFELSEQDVTLWPKFIPWYLQGFAEEHVMAFLETPEGQEADFEAVMQHIENTLLHKQNAAVTMIEMRQLVYDKRKYTLNEFLQKLMEKQMELKGGEALDDKDMGIVKMDFLYKLPQAYQDFITWRDDWESASVFEFLGWADHFESRQETRDYVSRSDKSATGFVQENNKWSDIGNKRPIGRNPYRGKPWEKKRSPAPRKDFGRKAAGADRRPEKESFPRKPPNDRDNYSSQANGGSKNRSQSIDSRAPYPGRTVTCYNCGGAGHYANECKKPRSSRPQAGANEIQVDQEVIESYNESDEPVTIYDLFDEDQLPFVRGAIDIDAIDVCDTVSDSVSCIENVAVDTVMSNLSPDNGLLSIIDAEDRSVQIDKVHVDKSQKANILASPPVVAAPKEEHVGVHLMIEGFSVFAKIDSGASATLLPYWVYERLRREKGQKFLESRKQNSLLTLRTYDGTPVESISQLVLEIDDGKRRGFVPCMIDSQSVNKSGLAKNALVGTNGMAILGYKIVDSEGVQLFPTLETEHRYVGLIKEFERRFGHLSCPVSSSKVLLDVPKEARDHDERINKVKDLIAEEMGRRKRLSNKSDKQLSTLEYEYWMAKLIGAENPRRVMEDFWRRSHKIQTETGVVANVKREPPESVHQKKRAFAQTTENFEMQPNQFSKERIPRPILKSNPTVTRIGQRKQSRGHSPKGVRSHTAPPSLRRSSRKDASVALREKKTVTFQDMVSTDSEESEPDEKGFCPVELAEDVILPPLPVKERWIEGAGKRGFIPLKAVSFENQHKRKNQAYRFKALNAMVKAGVYFADAIVIPDEYGYFSVEVYNDRPTETELEQCKVGYLHEVLLDVPIEEVAKEMVDMLYQEDSETLILEIEAEDMARTIDTVDSERKRTPNKKSDTKVEAEKSRELLLKEKLKIDGKGATPEEIELVRNTLLSKSKAFALSPEEMGKTDLCCHDIHLEDPNQAPINQKCRRLPYSVREEVTKEVQKLLRLGIIRQSDSDWASPIVPVRKKTGELRVCIDYRLLNGASRKDNSLLPNINDLIDEAGLTKSKWFSAIDLMMGYHQVGMTERAQRYSAFVCHLGQFTYLRMPFGLCNAPATFSNLMRKVQATLQRNKILVYMDDVLVTTQTVQEHAEQLAKLCDRLIEVGLTIKPEKSTFLKHEVLYLGFIVSANGIKADPEKLRTMIEFKRPVTPKQLRAFLGLCSYYRRFVKGFAQIASPLHDGLKGKPEKLLWTAEMEEAFRALRKKLTSPPVLAYPQVEKPYYLFTDASKTGFGCVLQQKDEKGRLHPIAYGSRTLSKEERNYGITDLEAGAVIFGIEHFDVYIRNQDCTIVVDHKALKDILLSRRNLANDRQIRWRNRFMGTGFKIKYTKGINQTVADTLSRHPCPDSEPTEPHPTDSDPYDDLLETTCERSIELNFLEDQGTIDTVAEDDFGQKRIISAGDPVTPTAPTTEEIRRAQLSDRFFREVIDYLERQKLPDSIESRVFVKEFVRDCEMYDGVLYYGRTGNVHEMRVAVPTDMRWELLKEAHFYTIGGHFGPKKTYLKLKNKYWWPHMKRDVLMFCKNCLVCRRRQGEKEIWTPPLSHLPTPEKPNDLIGIDLLKMPMTESGNQYILVATDCLTRKATTVALRTKEAGEIAQAIASSIFATVGPPARILSDKGSEFTAEVYKQLCFLCGVKTLYTTTFHPQGNAITERFNRVLVNGLSKLRTSSQINWDIQLPIFTMAYNDTLHRAHGYTPHEVQFGTPMNSISGAPVAGLQNPYKYNENVHDLIRSAQETWRLAKESIKKYNEETEKYFEQRVKKECPFKLGDFVWYRKTQPQKMSSPWTGPWKILELDLPNAKIGRKDPKSNSYLVEKVNVANLSLSTREDDAQQWGTATSSRAYSQQIHPPKYPDSFAGTAKASGVGELAADPSNKPAIAEEVPVIVEKTSENCDIFGDFAEFSDSHALDPDNDVTCHVLGCESSNIGSEKCRNLAIAREMHKSNQIEQGNSRVHVNVKCHSVSVANMVEKRENIHKHVMQKLSEHYCERPMEPVMKDAELENLEKCLMRSIDHKAGLDRWLAYRQSYVDKFGKPPLFHKKFKIPAEVTRSTNST